MQSLAVIVLHFFMTTLLVYGLLRLVAGRLGWRDDMLKWNVLAATLANVGYFGLAGLACPDRLAARHVDERESSRESGDDPDVRDADLFEPVVAGKGSTARYERVCDDYFADDGQGLNEVIPLVEKRQEKNLLPDFPKSSVAAQWQFPRQLRRASLSIKSFSPDRARSSNRRP